MSIGQCDLPCSWPLPSIPRERGSALKRPRLPQCLQPRKLRSERDRELCWDATLMIPLCNDPTNPSVRNIPQLGCPFLCALPISQNFIKHCPCYSHSPTSPNIAPATKLQLTFSLLFSTLLFIYCTLFYSSDLFSSILSSLCSSILYSSIFSLLCPSDFSFSTKLP